MTATVIYFSPALIYLIVMLTVLPYVRLQNNHLKIVKIGLIVSGFIVSKNLIQVFPIINMHSQLFYILRTHQRIYNIIININVPAKKHSKIITDA